MATDPPCPLAPHHEAALRNESGITAEVIRARGYHTEATKAGLKALGFADRQCRVPALVLPIWSVQGEIGTYQIRPDQPRVDRKGKTIKYETPRGTTMVLDVPPTVRANLGNPKQYLFVTEGVKKADALASHGCCVVALLGVWNWRGTNAHGGKTALPDWESVALNERQIYLVFDSDVMTKPGLHKALARLKAFLESRRARVALIYLQANGVAKVGVDDYLVAGHTLDDLLALAVPELQPAGHNDPPRVPYTKTPNGLVWHKPTRDGTLPVQLTNFAASIVADTTVDDGAETWRTYTIATVLNGRMSTFDVPATAFSSMTWVAEQLGAQAILYPGLGVREHARVAVQLLSEGIRSRQVYAHLGWRQVDDVWLYLHAGGAIGATGAVDDVEVRVDEALRGYLLTPPPAPEALREAVRASLRLLDLAPPEVMVPTYGALWRAVLAAGDLSIHIAGLTGAGKTALAALLQQHFGARMDAHALPANWTGSANALEALAFAAKDALLVIDEFTPTDTGHGQELHRKAERVFRAQANRSGRQRMRPDTTLRPPKPPRGFILSTGEDIPRGQSLRARMLILEVEPTSIEFTALTPCQQDASAGRYAQAMAGFVQWLAPRYAPLQARWEEEYAELRQAATYNRMHRRMPENIASLALGWRVFLHFAVDIDVLTLDDATTRWQEVWQTLGQIAATQGQYQAAAEPAARFLELLQNALADGRAYLQPLSGKHNTPPGRTRIGWREGDNVYLLPDTSYAVAQELGKATGDALPVSPQTLHKRLNEQQLLAATDPQRKTLKIRKTFDGQRHSVLALQKAALLPPSDQPDQPDQRPQHGASWSGVLPPLVRGRSGNADLSDHEKPLKGNALDDNGRLGREKKRVHDFCNTPREYPGRSSPDSPKNPTTQPDHEYEEGTI